MGSSGRTALFVFCLLRMRLGAGVKLALLQFIPPVHALALEGPGGFRWLTRDGAKRCYYRYIVKPVFQRNVLRAQVMTRWERESLSAFFDVAASRLTVIPWPLGDDAPPEYSSRARSGVLASGRASCDWPLVFAAAEGEEWPLTVVCSARDLPLVDRLNVKGRAVVLTEVDAAMHNDLVARSAVYLLALREDNVSSGQIRLANCVQHGTPVIVSSVRGILDYVSDGVTALTFLPGDHLRAREAIRKLLADEPLRRSLVEGAGLRASEWTTSFYHRATRLMVVDAIGMTPA